MDIRLVRGAPGRRAADAMAIGVGTKESVRRPGSGLDAATGAAIERMRARGDFAGRWLETAVLYPAGRGARRVIVVGLGPRAELDERHVREAAGQAARRARDLGAATLAMPVFGLEAGLDPARAAQLTAEGAALGAYRFTAYRSDPGPRPLRRIEIVVPDAPSPALRAAVARGAEWAEATCLARDLTNTPGDALTPDRLASRAREIARGAGARCRVLDADRLERLGAGALLAVGRGSPHPPCLIVLERDAPRAAGRVPTVVVIGKGITFDTGGISLKPRENMHRMKYDMAGAAAVLGLFSALPTLAPAFRVVGLVASAENMPDGSAFKPGDVLRTLDGTTVEVTNTDAEGRLVLADALAYARRYEPEAVVDLATLTGAISIALGHHGAGLFTRDEALGRELADAAAASGERVWPMPIWDEATAELRSDTADLVNATGMREGGAVVAAAFLRHFARGMRWAHLDIASTAWAYADRALGPRGAVGFGVRLLLEWLSRRASSPPGGSGSGAASPAARSARPAGRSARGPASASARRGRPRPGRSSRRRRS